MSDRVMQFRVGVVVLATAIITGILIVLFGDLPSLVQATYPLKMSFTDARGVADGTPVRKNGILVGRVSRDPFEVFATLEPKLGGAMQSLAEASESVKKLTDNLDRLLLGEDDKFSSMVQKTDAALDAFNLAMANINDVMGDPQARANLKQTLNSLPDVINDLRTTVQGIGETVDTADRNLRNLEGLTKPLGERGEGMVAQIDVTIGRLDETLQQASMFTKALNESQGTLGKLVRDPQVYNDLAQAAGNVNRLTRELRPIVDDVRVFTDKIARHPEQLGVKGALDRRAGLK